MRGFSLVVSRSQPSAGPSLESCGGLGESPGFVFTFSPMPRLEVQLQRKLPDAWRLRQCDLPEGAHCRTIRHSTTEADAARRDELRVVEHIEHFHSKFQIHAFRDGCVLMQSDVPIVDAGSVKESASRVSFCSDRGGSERRWVEEIMTAIDHISRIQNVNRANLIGSVDRKHDGASKCGTEEGVVIGFNQSDRKAGREICDSAEGPSVCQAFRSTEGVERKHVIVANDEIMS